MPDAPRPDTATKPLNPNGDERMVQATKAGLRVRGRPISPSEAQTDAWEQAAEWRDYTRPFASERDIDERDARVAAFVESLPIDPRTQPRVFESPIGTFVLGSHGTLAGKEMSGGRANLAGRDAEAEDRLGPSDAKRRTRPPAQRAG